ncbi:MAG TPA: ABC transporter permease [Longimicrobiales bacterium]|nr:ABC transporter permease [Longimicrobiales bacterium]
MSRIMPVFKREFTEAVGTRSFLIGTILGPLLMVGIFAAQFLIIAKSGGGNHEIAILDASGRGLGAGVGQVLEAPQPRIGFIAIPTFSVQVERVDAGTREQAAERLRARVLAEELDGFLFIPPDIATGGTAEYEGDDATNSGAMSQLRQAVQRAVQSERLGGEGIDEAKLGAALAPVRFSAVKTAGGNPTAARLLAFFMAFAMYMLVIIYGQSIMQSVLEEKRDRIVELIVSSIRARDLLIGKIAALGAAGLLQMLTWVVTAAILLTNSAAVAGLIGVDATTVQMLTQTQLFPELSASTGILVLIFFLGGFLLFATLFAVIGAIVTNAPEAQQFVFPVLLPFIIGLFIAMPAAENPGSAIAVAGSIVPFTAAMVMPVRVLMSNAGWGEILLAIALLYVSAFATVWLAAKIYRFGIFATGRKPSLAEIAHWLRTA